VLAWDKSASRRARGWRVRMLRAVKGSLVYSLNKRWRGLKGPRQGYWHVLGTDREAIGG
jgi:hypothetical protein